MSEFVVRNMEQVKVCYDPVGASLTVWFDDPEKESIAEEIGDEIILMKDEHGKLLGFEKLNVSFEKPQRVQFAVETVSA